MTDLAVLVALHARLILEARESEALAARNPDHHERETSEAEARRIEAAALATLLAPHGLEPPPSGQMQLFGDGR
jgi:hypothetical protein